MVWLVEAVTQPPHTNDRDCAHGDVDVHPKHAFSPTATGSRHRVLQAGFSSRPRQWGQRSAQCLLEFPKKEMLTNDSTNHGFSEVGLGGISSPRVGAGVGSLVR